MRRRGHTTSPELSGIQALLAAVAARDPSGADQPLSVVALAVDVARELGLSRDDVERVAQVTTLREVGKIGIPDAILAKQGPLEPGEWEAVKRHPLLGEQIVASVDGLAHLAPLVRAVHENWDGSGYPDGLRGDEIPLESRIALCCEAFHKMTCERPYRAAMSPTAARQALHEGAGSQFCPEVASALLTVLYRESVEEVAPLAHEGEVARLNGMPVRTTRRGRLRRALRLTPWRLRLGSLLIGLPLGLWLALPVPDVSQQCGAPGEGQVLCEIHKAWGAAATTVMLAPVFVLLVARLLFVGLPALVRRWRVRRSRPPDAPAVSPPADRGPFLLAATWTAGGEPDRC